MLFKRRGTARTSPSPRPCGKPRSSQSTWSAITSGSSTPRLTHIQPAQRIDHSSILWVHACSCPPRLGAGSSDRAAPTGHTGTACVRGLSRRALARPQPRRHHGPFGDGSAHPAPVAGGLRRARGDDWLRRPVLQPGAGQRHRDGGGRSTNAGRSLRRAARPAAAPPREPGDTGRR